MIFCKFAKINVCKILSGCEFYKRYIKVLHKIAILNVRDIRWGLKTRNILDAKLKGFTVTCTTLIHCGVIVLCINMSRM